jgi:sec-independent protein translocase protein TatB
MFDLSFAELMLIVVVAVLFIGPKELPVVMKAVAKGLRGLKSLASELRAAFSDLAKDSGVEDITKELDAEMRYIRGDDGKLYESYTTKPPEKSAAKEVEGD